MGRNKRRTRSKKVMSSSASTDSTQERSSNPPRPRRTRKRSKTQELEKLQALQTDTDFVLYSLLGSNLVDVNDVVLRLVELYKRDSDDAILKLMQLQITASGCNAKITMEMILSRSHEQIFSALSNALEDDKIELQELSKSPLLAGGKEYKPLQENFPEFMGSLISQIQLSILYDGILMESLISILTSLCHVGVTHFNYTGTLAASKVVSSLESVLVDLEKRLHSLQRQQNTEKSKRPGTRSIDRLQTLREQETEFLENREELRQMLSHIIKSIFLPRCLDSLPRTRIVCVRAICEVIGMRFNFFDSKVLLRHPGWLLHDPNASCRLAAVESLLPLYSEDEDHPLVEGLESFTRHFKERMLRMTQDVSHRVSERIVDLLTRIRRCSWNCLVNDDLERIFRLVYSQNRGVAVAAAEFSLLLMLEDVSNDLNITLQRNDDAPLLLRNVIIFHKESRKSSLAIPYLVDAFIDNCECLKRWNCMTGMLLEPGLDQELTEAEEDILVELMVCCARRVALGTIPRGRETSLKEPSSQTLENDRRQVSLEFMERLPVLLDKFRSDRRKLGKLLEIPSFFECRLYSEMRLEWSLERLLQDLEQILENSSDPEVVDNVAKSFAYLCRDQANPFASKCQVSRSRALDFQLEKYREATKEWEKDESGNENLRYDSLQKIASFYCTCDLNSLELWSSLAGYLLESRRASSYLPEKVVSSSMQACYWSLLWDRHRLMKSEYSREHDQDDDAGHVKERLEFFMESIIQFLAEDNIPDKIQEKAYDAACDILLFFSEELRDSPNNLHQLVYKPTTELRRLMLQFLDNNVFVEDSSDPSDLESHFLLMSKKRKFLAGYTKLLNFNVFPVITSWEIFKFYPKNQEKFGDILELSMKEVRDINELKYALAVFRSLKHSFMEWKFESADSTNGHNLLLAMAKKLSATFGTADEKYRQALAKIHCRGMLFALSPADGNDSNAKERPNLDFFDFLTEFSHNMIGQDKLAVLQCLDQNVTSMLPPGTRFPALEYYRRSLIGEKRSKASGKKGRRQPPEEVASLSGEEELEAV